MTYFYAPDEIWQRLTDKTIPKNGCGAGWTALFIPDKWFGLDFTIPCAIHDEMYALGKTKGDKKEADRIFYNNMMRAVGDRPFYLQFIGKRLAFRYYQAVDIAGAVAFWDGKNNPDEMRTAIVDTTKNGIKIVKTIGSII